MNAGASPDDRSVTPAPVTPAAGQDGAGLPVYQLPVYQLPVYRLPGRLPEALRGAAVAIGNFDGVHKGHQAVIAACAGFGRPVGVLTFEPHPRQVFRPGDPPFRLTPWPAKVRRLAAAGATFAAVIPFDADFARRSAEDFIDSLLLGDLGVGHVTVGPDFCFGYQRRGTTALLDARLRAAGCGFHAVAPASDATGEPYSSTRARTALQTGRPEAAAAVLGIPWEIEGPVVEGDRRGRLLGFPTANIALGEHLHPAYGVYAVRAGLDIGGGVAWFDGVANIGARPTVGGVQPRLEAHLFGVALDLYGRTLRVALHHFLRPERRFDGLDALQAQIAADAAAARAFLAGPEADTVVGASAGATLPGPAPEGAPGGPGR